MSNEKDNFCELQALWIEENLITMKSCEQSIADYEQQIEIERKMIEQYKLRIRMAIDVYNKQAEKHGIDQMHYPF